MRSGRVALDGLKRLPSAGHGAHVVTRALQHVRQEPQVVDRVVDDQHAGQAGRIPIMVHRAFSIRQSRHERVVLEVADQRANLGRDVFRVLLAPDPRANSSRFARPSIAASRN